MGTVRKREWISPAGSKMSAWVADYSDQSGKRRAKQFRTKREALEYLDQAKNEVRFGVHTHQRDSISVADAADMWVAAVEAEGRERSTTTRYRQLARLYIKPRLGALKLTALTKPLVNDFRAELLSTKPRATAAKVMQALSAILNKAMESGAINQNVAANAKVTKAKRETKKIAIPTREELRAMIAAATDLERPFLLTAIITGLRSSELRGLRWVDIDLDAGILSVNQRADQWGVIGPPKSEAGRRSIPIPAELVRELRRWKLRCPKSFANLAFPSRLGTPLRHNNMLRRTFFPLQVRAGLGVPVIDSAGEAKLDADGKPLMTGKYSFHTLRHAAASNWIESNIDLKRLQVWIGHENIQLTIDTYGHLLADTKKDAEFAMRASRALFA